jgi:hypothetical protein
MHAMSESVSTRPLATFEEFWPFYVAQHSKEGTRALHFAGTTAGLAWLLAAAAFRRPHFLLHALVSSYGLAWIGHFFVEKNRPATFTYPLWSLAADFRMYGLMWQRKMSAEVARIAGATGK